MKWLEHSVSYAGSDLSQTALERGVIGAVGDRAQVYCIACALAMDVCVVGEVFSDTKHYRDAICDKCGQPVLRLPLPVENTPTELPSEPIAE